MPAFLGRNPTLPCGPERSLQRARVASRVEQRLAVAVGAKPSPIAGQQAGIERELQHKGFVVGEGIGDELRQADRAQLAPRYAAGEGLAGAGHHRQAGEQRVIGRRVCIAGKGIEEKVGDVVAAEVLLERNAGREDQPLRRDLAIARFLSQVVAARRIRIQEPQHAARSFLSARIQASNTRG